MSVSRRSFIRAIGAGGAALLPWSVAAARGRETLAATGWTADGTAAPSQPIRLDSNEHPFGPGAKALDAMRTALAESSRYPDAAADALTEAIAAHHRVSAANVLATCGSTELLRMAVHAFASPSRPLVTARPTFEACTRTARFLKTGLGEVRVDDSQAIDLVSMAAHAAGAGLVYLCNPNNPTGTVHGEARVAGFVRAVAKTSPDTVVLVDEAYHEFVEDPGYRTAVPLAMENRQVIVCRTFSKVHGLAGLRIGYAIGRPEILERLSGWRLVDGLNAIGIRAAIAALGDHEHVERSRAVNREGREVLRRFFHDRGFAVADSHANFVLADIRRDAAAFQRACRESGVAVGRPFPPLDTWTRVTVGTPDEIRGATDVFATVLGRAVSSPTSRDGTRRQTTVAGD